jgi:predicted nucleic-acid-binding protein
MKVERFFADTNLFLRYLTDDIPEQAEAVGRLLKRAAKGECQLFTSTLVIAEVVWTMESYYKLSKPDIRSKVLAILNTPGLVVAEGEMILQAIMWYADKNVDFIDAFNAACITSQDIHAVSTFDRRHFARFEGIEIFVPGE